MGILYEILIYAILPGICIGVFLAIMFSITYCIDWIFEKLALKDKNG